jgi:hypothetical protein
VHPLEAQVSHLLPNGPADTFGHTATALPSGNVLIAGGVRPFPLGIASSGHASVARRPCKPL